MTQINNPYKKEINSFSVTNVKLSLICPRIFIFNKYYKKKPFPYTGLVLGSIIHNILDTIVKKLKNVNDLKDFITIDDSIDIKKFEAELQNFAYNLYYKKIIDFQNKFQKLSDIEKNVNIGWILIKKSLEIILKLLFTAFSLHPSVETISKVFLANERSFKVNIPEISDHFYLTGRIDSLWMNLESKDVMLIDFKTSSITSLPTDISQLALYAYAVYRELNFKPNYYLYYLTQSGLIEKQILWTDMESILPNVFDHIKKMQRWAINKKACEKTSTPRLCLTCHLYNFCKQYYPHDPPPSKEDFRHFDDLLEKTTNSIQQQLHNQNSSYNSEILNNNQQISSKTFYVDNEANSIEQDFLNIGSLLENSQKDALLETKHLNRHIAILGNPGAGKTVLSKVIIEELLLQGYSSILIDPQGDLCSLLLPNDDIGQLFHETINFKIFTPGSKKGIPLSLDLFEDPNPLLLKDEDYVNMLLDNVSTNILNIIGIELKKGIPSEKTLLESIIYQSWLKKERLDFQNLAQKVIASEEIASISTGQKIPLEQLISPKKQQQLAQKLTTISAGTEGFLFFIGETIDIQKLLDSGPSCYIINLQGLGTDQNKRQLVLSWILRQIYNWMLTHPQAEQDELRLFFYIDEVADFLPIHPNNPSSKKMLILLLRQARKYGVGIMIATQSPGSIEYKALDNINTFFIGKTPTTQSAKKISNLISPYLNDNPLKLDLIIKQIQKSNVGEFFIIHPGQLSKTFLKVRKLHTKHETISLDRIKTLNE